MAPSPCGSCFEVGFRVGEWLHPFSVHGSCSYRLALLPLLLAWAGLACVSYPGLCTLVIGPLAPLLSLALLLIFSHVCKNIYILIWKYLERTHLLDFLTCPPFPLWRSQKSQSHNSTHGCVCGFLKSASAAVWVSLFSRGVGVRRLSGHPSGWRELSVPGHVAGPAGFGAPPCLLPCGGLAPSHPVEAGHPPS